MFNQLLDYLKNGKNPVNNNVKKEDDKTSKDLAKQRLHVLLVQDRASVSSDFIDIMKNEIMEVVSKYVILKTEEVEMDITTTINNDGQKTDTGILLKIPFENVRNEMKSEIMKQENEKIEEKFEEKKKEALNLNTPEELNNNTVVGLNKAELEYDITASEEELRQLELLKEQFKQSKTSVIKKTIDEIEQNTQKEYTKVLEVEKVNENDEILEDINLVINTKNEN